MGFIANILIDVGLFLFAGGTLVVTSVFAVKAAVEVTDVDDWDKDDNLKKAHSWLTWASVAGWISVALIITLVVLYLVFGLETAEFTAGLVAKGLLLLTLAVMVVTGSFAAVGASFIDKSSKSSEAKSEGAYRDAIIAAVSALLGAAIIGGTFLWKMFHKPKKKGEEKKDETKRQIEELQKKLVEEKEAQIEAKKAEFKAKTRKLS